MTISKCKNCGCKIYEFAKHDSKMYKALHYSKAEHDLNCKCRKPEMSFWLHKHNCDYKTYSLLDNTVHKGSYVLWIPTLCKINPNIIKMKHKKLFGFLECDTILSGDWSRQGKLHTIENGIRFLAVWGIIISTTNSNNWIGWILIVPSIFGVGFVIKPKFMRPEYEVRLW